MTDRKVNLRPSSATTIPAAQPKADSKSASVFTGRARLLQATGVSHSSGGALPPLADGKTEQARRVRLQAALGTLIAKFHAAACASKPADDDAQIRLIEKFLSSEGELATEPAARDAVLEMLMHGFEALERTQVAWPGRVSSLSDSVLFYFSFALELNERPDNLKAVLQALPPGESLIAQPGKARLITALCREVSRRAHRQGEVFSQLVGDRFLRECPEWITAVSKGAKESTASFLDSLLLHWNTLDRAQKEALFDGTDPRATVKFAHRSNLEGETFAIAASCIARQLRDQDVNRQVSEVLVVGDVLELNRRFREDTATLLGCAFGANNTPSALEGALESYFGRRNFSEYDIEDHTHNARHFLRGARLGSDPLSVLRGETLSGPARLALARKMFVMPELLRAEHARHWETACQAAQLSQAQADELLALAGPASPAFLAALLRRRMEALLGQWRALPPFIPDAAATKGVETKHRAGPSDARLDARALEPSPSPAQPPTLNPEWGARAPLALALIEQIDRAYGDYARHTGIEFAETGDADAARPHVTPRLRDHWREFRVSEASWLASLEDSTGDLQDFVKCAQARLAALGQTPAADVPAFQTSPTKKAGADDKSVSDATIAPRPTPLTPGRRAGLTDVRPLDDDVRPLDEDDV